MHWQLYLHCTHDYTFWVVFQGKTKLMFDVYDKVSYREPIPVCQRTTYQVHIKGGILADEMGLGKTITLLGKQLSI